MPKRVRWAPAVRTEARCARFRETGVKIHQADPNLRWKKSKKDLCFSARHSEKLRELCGKIARKDATYWGRVIFTDEKQFLFDDSDGSSNYWADSSAAVRVLKQRQAGGGGIMMWAGIYTRRSAELVAIRDKFGSVRYCPVLEGGLLPFIDTKYGEDSEINVFDKMVQLLVHLSTLMNG